MGRKVKPTPTRWQVVKWEDERPVVDGFAFVIADSRGHGLFKALTYGDDPKTRANAEHVVRCVNSHANLTNEVERLRRVLRCVVVSTPCTCTESVECVRCAAKANLGFTG